MFRVFYIIRNLYTNNQVNKLNKYCAILLIFTLGDLFSHIYIQNLKDWKLALAVGVFVLVDIIILLIHTIIEDVMGDLNAKLVHNEENPSSEVGVRIICMWCDGISLIKSEDKVEFLVNDSA